MIRSADVLATLTTDEWTEEEREAWIADEMAGRPVLRPHAEHEEGECNVCDSLRRLQRVAEERDTPGAPT